MELIINAAYDGLSIKITFQKIADQQSKTKQNKTKNQKKATATTPHYYGKSDSLGHIVVLNTLSLASRSVYALKIFV